MRIGKGIVALHTSRLVNGAFLATVDLTKLEFPPYQRDEIKQHIAAIARNWDDQFARPLQISLRDKKLNTFDGRQTSKAALIVGKKTLPALVWDNWTYEREAAAFFTFNDVPKRMAGWKKFSADLAAGNAANLLIVETIHKAGLTTPLHDSVVRNKDADMPTSSIVTQVMRKGGVNLLVLFVKVMKGWKVQGKGVIPSVAQNADFGRGLIDFLFNNQHNAKVIVEVLKVVSPDQIQQLAKRMPSKSRTDANQIRQSLESLTGFRLKLANFAA